MDHHAAAATRPQACQQGFRRDGGGLDAQLATVREMDGQDVGEIAKVTGLPTDGLPADITGDSE
jgi:hypothetical protein